MNRQGLRQGLFPKAATFICHTLLWAVGLACVQQGKYPARLKKGDSRIPNIQRAAAGQKHPEFALFHPEKAKVTVSATKLKSRVLGPDLALPTFGIRFNGNDYIMILRCQAAYRSFLESMINRQGQGGISERKWVWLDALGNSAFCKIASRRFSSSEFSDIGAFDGDFFYVVNPCVSKSISITGKDQCSYHLTITNTIGYKNSPAVKFLALSASLGDAESAYDAHVSRLTGLARALINSKHDCEHSIMSTESRNNLKSFGWDVLYAGLAVSGVFAARGILRAASETAASPTGMGYYLNKSKAAVSFLKKLNNNEGLNRATQITSGIFAAAIAIRSTLKMVEEEAPDSSSFASCKQADQIASEIVQLQQSRALELATKEIISISEKLSALDHRFSGYSEDTFSLQPE